MYHLAIECSGIRGSVASFEGENLLTGLTLPDDSSSVQSLAPCLLTLLNARSGRVNSPTPPAADEPASVGFCELERTSDGEIYPKFLSVTVGPGSFTSLRVGLATTKMLAYAWKIPVVAICSLQAIAAAAAWQSHSAAAQPTQSMQPTRIVAVMNAYRGQVFAASWLWQAEKLHLLAPPQVLDASQWCSAPFHSLKRSSSAASSFPILIAGPGLSTYLPQPASSSEPFELAPQSIWEPQAAVVGRIGWQKFQHGDITTAEALAPNYIRASAAEEKK